LDFPPAVAAALNDLSLQLNLSTDQITVVEFESVSWPDSCLGAASPGELCLQVITPGYRIVLEAMGQLFEYHTDASGTVIRLASGVGAVIGPSKPGLDLNKPLAVLAAMRFLSQSEGIPMGEISLSSIEAIEWPDSCLGVPQEDEVCAATTIPGWLILLEVEDTQYELHADISGDNIRQK
jgi:hypothetical protein